MRHRAVRVLYRPSWRIRRRVVALTLLFCAGEIVYLTGWAGDTDLAKTIASGILILAGSVIGSYVFGATWDDSNVMRWGGELAAPAAAVDANSAATPSEEGS